MAAHADHTIASRALLTGGLGHARLEATGITPLRSRSQIQAPIASPTSFVPCAITPTEALKSESVPYCRPNFTTTPAWSEGYSPDAVMSPGSSPTTAALDTSNGPRNIT